MQCFDTTVVRSLSPTVILPEMPHRALMIRRPRKPSLKRPRQSAFASWTTSWWQTVNGELWVLSRPVERRVEDRGHKSLEFRQLNLSALFGPGC